MLKKSEGSVKVSINSTKGYITARYAIIFLIPRFAISVMMRNGTDLFSVSWKISRM